MRTIASKALVFAFVFGLAGCAIGSPATAREKQMKEWTFMLFLNGHNNLDSYGAININQLETVGSTADVDFVVQWASSAADTTKRIHVEKDTDTDKVTSPVIEDMPRVDMGDYQELVKFVKWTVEHYPSKHYFIALWNHGSGWERNGVAGARSISFDDFSGHHMTTEQVGDAMKQAAEIIGHKVDIVGSDACLMAMLEVNEQFAPWVATTVASEELEPALGWPYDTLAARWTAKPRATAADIVTILTEEYQKLYLPGGPGFGHGDVTLSSADLSKGATLNAAIQAFGEKIRKLDHDSLAKVKAASEAALRFYTEEYVDLGDFVKEVAKQEIPGFDHAALEPLRNAISAYVISNHTTPKYELATGISFWLPTSSWNYDSYKDRYEGLRFDKATEWSKTVSALVAE